jgi:streptomycin 6-kinase
MDLPDRYSDLSEFRQLSFLPDQLIRTAIELWGAAGTEWLKRLPAIIADCERRWSLTVDSPFPELSANYVAPAVRADDIPAVLKISFPEEEFIAEAEALRLFDGCGAVRLLELDLAQGAMLLERLEPGVPLDTIEDDEAAMSIAADVLRQLWRLPPTDHSFPLVSDWAQGLVRLRRHFGGETGPLPAVLVKEAEALFDELIPSQAEPRLLHGDLHHGNILAAHHRPWLAIDPKGVVGEPAFDTGALLYNPVELLDAARPAKVLERRLDQLAEELNLDGARVRGWGLSRAVLAAYWGWEDSGQVWKEALAFAELLAAIRA